MFTEPLQQQNFVTDFLMMRVAPNKATNFLDYRQPYVRSNFQCINHEPLWYCPSTYYNIIITRHTVPITSVIISITINIMNIINDHTLP